MTRQIRLVTIAACAAVVLGASAAPAGAQFYYDPFWGPHYWWPGGYPYWYYDDRGGLSIKVTPEEEAEDAAVYLDGFYAGSVDDFDGTLQWMPVEPGGHTVVLYLEGWRTAKYNIYVSRGSTFKIRHAMERLPAGEKSELPDAVRAVRVPRDDDESS